MTKKHFIALADTIKHHPELFNREAIAVLATFCAQQSNMFKGDRWLSYIAGTCGKNGGKAKETVSTT